MDMIWSLLSMLTFLGVPLLVIILVVSGVVYMFRKKDGDIDLGSLLRLYIYLVLFITLPLAAIGASITVSVGFSQAFGVPFSYDIRPLETYYREPIVAPDSAEVAEKPLPKCYDSEEAVFDGQTYCFDTAEPKKDLVTGVSILVSMVILHLVHLYGLSRMKKEKRYVNLGKMYRFLTLGLFSLIGIVFTPIALYQLGNYLLFNSEDLANYDRYIPGQSLAIVLSFVPIWIYKLRQVMSNNG